MASADSLAPIILTFWGVALFGWILMLAAAAALQQNCTRADHNAVTLAGVIGYLGPVACSKFYAYTWWIVWYLFLAIVLVPTLVVAGGLDKFRMGLLGLLGPLTMLVGDVANTFFYFNNLRDVPTKTLARARTMGSGAVIASIALFILIALIGIVDEDKEKVEVTGEPTGETQGGRYVPQEGTTSYNPTYTA